MKLAFVFPGQGSQSLGMMREYSQHAEIRMTFQEAADILGTDFWKLVEEGPEAALNQTVNTQPLMLTADIAVYRAWQSAGGAAPAVVAGHSLGEYAALVAAGAISFAQALPLVRVRAQAMQRAVPEGQGGIAAILGLEEAPLREACAAAAQGEVVAPANLNAPGQIVIAGAKSAVERAIEIAKTKGAKRALMLPMSVPAHCALMKPATTALDEALNNTQINTPKIALINNVDVATPNDAAAIRDALLRQLYSPVRWIETVSAMAQSHGVTHIVECGPGKVLQGMVKRIAGTVANYSLSSSQAIVDAVAQCR